MNVFLSLRRHRTPAAAAAALVVLAPVLAACGSGSSSAADSHTVKVGVIFSTSGDIAAYGVPAWNGTKEEAKLLNASGGLGNRKIQLYFEDSKSDPAQAALAARRLITKDGVDVIIGPEVSDAELAVSPIAAQYKIPMMVTVSGTAVMPEGSAAYRYSFRAVTMNTDVVRKQLEEASKSGKNIGVFYQDDAYGTAMWADVQKLAPSMGLKVVAVTSAPPTATNLAPQATKLADAKPDVIVAGMSYPAMSGAVLKALKDAGVTVPVWGDTGSATGATAQAAGSAVNGMDGLAFADWTNPTPMQKQLADALIKAGKPAPTGVQTIQGANALYLISKAAESIKGDISPASMESALENVCHVQGLLGAEACFTPTNHNGYGADAVLPVTYQDGNWVTLK